MVSVCSCCVLHGSAGQHRGVQPRNNSARTPSGRPGRCPGMSARRAGARQAHLGSSLDCRQNARYKASAAEFINLGTDLEGLGVQPTTGSGCLAVSCRRAADDTSARPKWRPLGQSRSQSACRHRSEGVWIDRRGPELHADEHDGGAGPSFLPRGHPPAGERPWPTAAHPEQPQSPPCCLCACRSCHTLPPPACHTPELLCGCRCRPRTTTQRASGRWWRQGCRQPFATRSGRLHCMWQRCGELAGAALVACCAGRPGTTTPTWCPAPPCRGSVEAARELLDLGADVNVENSRGSTPLHFAAAAKARARETCQLLLDAGADTGVPDLQGRLPYEMAESDDIRWVWAAAVWGRGGQHAGLPGKRHPPPPQQPASMGQSHCAPLQGAAGRPRPPHLLLRHRRRRGGAAAAV